METELERENQRLRQALARTVDTLDEERAFAAAKKNRASFVQIPRAVEQDLRELQESAPAAALALSALREHMQIGTNAVTISNRALGAIINRGRATVTRAVAHLAEHQFVQIVKTGNVNTYVVNERVAFAGSAGQRKAIFSATVVAHEIEQSADIDAVAKLKAVPIIGMGERPIVAGGKLPAPEQEHLRLD